MGVVVHAAAAWAAIPSVLMLQFIHGGDSVR